MLHTLPFSCDCQSQEPYSLTERTADISCIQVKVQIKRSIRAVIVTEHENVSNLLLDDRAGVQNNIIVTTSGYPGHSTAEFLHMLSKAEMLKDVPFLYIADHDFHGFHIFSVLKYGCRSSAWASEIQTCPQLQWIGPSRKDLVKSPANYLPQWEVQYRADHPRASDDDVKKESENWKAQLASRIDQKFVRTYQKDKEMYRGFQRTGWLSHEPAIRRELDLMLRQDSKFRVADLALVNAGYLQMFMEAKIAKKTPLMTQVEKSVPVRVPSRRSPVGEKFKQIPSQAPEAEAEQAKASPQPTKEELDTMVAEAMGGML